MTPDRPDSGTTERPEGAPGINDPGVTPPAVDEAGPGVEADASAPDGGSEVEQDLEALVEEARSKADEYLDLAQRTQADFENFRKRMAGESQAAARRGSLAVVEGVITAIDNLERVLDAAGIDRKAALTGEIPADAPVGEQGVIVAWRDLHTVLRQAGVEPYSPAGEQFDPTWHEAMQALPAEGVESGTVLEVMQRGYRADETVLRAARVVVAQ